MFVYKVYWNLHVKLFTLKICFTFCWRLIFSCFRLLMILLPSEIFVEFGLLLRPREIDWRSGLGCWWSSSCSMKIGHWWFEGLRWILFHCLLTPESYMKAIIRIGSKLYFKHLTSLPRRIVWLWLNEIVSFHNLMTWPHLLVEVILVSVLYGGLRTCSVVSPF